MVRGKTYKDLNVQREIGRAALVARHDRWQVDRDLFAILIVGLAGQLKVRLCRHAADRRRHLEQRVAARHRHANAIALLDLLDRIVQRRAGKHTARHAETGLDLWRTERTTGALQQPKLVNQNSFVFRV